MDTTFLLKFTLEFVGVSFLIYRVLVFFLTRRNLFTLFILLILSILLMTEVPSLLISHSDWIQLYKMIFGSIAVILAFQPETQWFLRRYRASKPEKKFLEKNGPLDEIVKACQILSSTKTGALLAIKRNEGLTPYIDKSVVIDSKIRHELLLTIFTPPTYLHDGGIIISNNRIVSCSAIFPLTQNSKLKKDLGTRHRAALGLSEETDALCIIVSEETGAVSIADRGKLYYNIRIEDLRSSIEKLMRFKKPSQLRE